MSQVARYGFGTLRRVAVAGTVVAAGLGFGAIPAHATPIPVPSVVPIPTLPMPSPPPPPGTPADLSIKLETIGNAFNVEAHNAGPGAAGRGVITVTGLGNYTVSNLDFACAQSGSTLTCTYPIGVGYTFFEQPNLSGGTGSLTLHATVVGYYQPIGSNDFVQLSDPNQANNSFDLTWAPSGTTGGGSTGGGKNPGGSAGSGATKSGGTAAASASPSASPSASASASPSPSPSASVASESATASAPPTKASLDAAAVAHSSGSNLTPLWVVLALLLSAAAVGGTILVRKRRVD